VKSWIAGACVALAVALSAPSLALGSEGGEHAGAHEAVGHAPHINWVRFYPGAGEGDGPPIAIALFNFAVLLLILRKLFGKSLSDYLQTRHTSIKSALEEGKRLREEARQKLAEYTEKIANVDAEISALVAAIRQSAEEEKARILAQAEAQAAALERDAKERIAAEIERSRATLEREVVDAAIAAAETILRSNARDDDQRRLAETFIASLGAPAPATKSDDGAVDDNW
jgi:F-type H+-transporting ATPase subunit b